MKYFINFSILILLLAFGTGIRAQFVNPERAQKVAQNLFTERTITAGINLRNNVSFHAVDQIEKDGQVTIYIFNESNGNGFVLMSADERAYPVLGYSFEGSFSKHQLHPSIEEWLNSYSAQIAEIRSKNYPAGEKTRTAWKRYEKESRAAVRSVEHLVTSIWGQDCFYNEMCPVDNIGACGHARVGCVATAMAQILRYHKWPQQGEGSHSYTSSYGVLSVNYTAANYDYDQMPDYVTDYNDEVAEIGYHCGVSVDMMYGPGGSGAYSQDVADALIDHFRCDAATTQHHSKSAYGNEEWENMVRNDLDNGRPIYYSGSGSGGHAFVLDGYQETSHFHFNWGWGGLYNGYFYLNNLNPGTHNYSSSQAAVFGIQSEQAPVVDFEASANIVLTGAGINFEDHSTSNPNQWQWTFEGGTPASSSQQNPQNIKYNTAGTYSVTLKAYNVNGNATEVKQGFITVSDDALPLADFAAEDTIVYVEYSSVKFRNYSQNGADSYKWIFEPASISYTNGTSSTSEEPRVRFNEAGQYNVSLIALNQNGSDTMIRQQYIYAGGYPIPFYENFELAFAFTEKWEIENNDGTIGWDGYYKISGNGNSRRAAWMNCYDYVTIGQRDQLISPALNTVGHNQLFLDFVHAYAAYNDTRRDSLIVKVSTNAGSTWKRVAAYGEDGNGSFATTPATTYLFEPDAADQFCGVGYGSNCYTIDLTEYAGNPNLKIMFESWNGHGNSIYVDDVLVHDPGVYAGFNSDVTEFCESGDVNFFENARGEPTSWKWNFEGGTPATSTEQNPAGIHYDSPGYYEVELIVSNGIYSDTLSVDKYIGVLTTPGKAPVPNAPDEICQDGASSFISVAAVEYAQSYNWEILPNEAGIISGNGTFASINWSEDYFGAVELRVQAANMCGEGSFSDPQVITIHETPVAYAGDDQEIASGESTILEGSANGASGSYTYHWEPANMLVNPDIQNPETVALSSSQWFWLQVADSETSCESKADSVFIMIQGDVLAVAASADPVAICAGENSQLNAAASGGDGSYEYIWTSNPEGFQSTEASPLVNPDNSAWYIVEVRDGNNTAKDSVFIEVYTLPEVNLGPDSVICDNQSITLDAGEAASYAWSNGETGRYLAVDKNTFGLGSHDIWVDVTNENNCSKRDDVTIELIVCTGIKESFTRKLKLYPNPAQDILNIDGGGIKIIKMEIYAADGRITKSVQDWNASTASLSLQGLHDGLYFIRIYHEDGLVNDSFVIKH